MVFARLVALHLWLPIASGAAPGAGGARRTRCRHITVVGHARTEVVPDFVTMSLAVVTEQPTASAAAAANAQAAHAVSTRSRTQGIDPKDIQTSEVSLTPVYETLSDAISRTRPGNCAATGLAMASRSTYMPSTRRGRSRAPDRQRRQ